MEACQRQSDARRVWLDHALRCGYEPRPSSVARNKQAATAVGAGHPDWARTAYSVDDWIDHAGDALWQNWKAASDLAFEAIHGLIAPQIQMALVRYGLEPSDAIVDELWSRCRDKARHALDLFDFRLGFAPSTYVVCWVKSAILRLCAAARTVSLETDLRGSIAATSLAQTESDNYYDLIDAGISVADLEAYLDGRASAAMEQAAAGERASTERRTRRRGPVDRSAHRRGARPADTVLALRTLRDRSKARRADAPSGSGERRPGTGPGTGTGKA